ncbi:2-octaprenylphenol hydroxylase [Candidatus Kinetoplastibacterium sorsogonicusi]|uniref:2-octaprenylphenol hydroxylase n=1 Tax=Candidatus Kinetoplastidibacterium kentomonadis TaxID=1576550 RepID=A0A3S7J936_9PROT|nr:FAD-dependent monooxygenase [Candidatus Kinetoplastibacterium sorsogonicusi]AWD32189.1 2-octaprenylphenol hydroxylase [Candidatus Kinetoplastibacterium sorsogonicusi]
MENNYEIAICGAGIVGLACALAFAKKQKNLVIISPKYNFYKKDNISRVYAISLSSKIFLDELNIWNKLSNSSITSVNSMEIYGDNGGFIELDCLHVMLPELSWIVESDEIERVILNEIIKMDIPWIYDNCIEYTNGLLKTYNGTAIKADLIVGADGAKSTIRKIFNIQSTSKDYHSNAIIANISVEKYHNNIAYQWFFEKNILGVLPIYCTNTDNQVSIVLSLNNKDFFKIQKMDLNIQKQYLINLINPIISNKLGNIININMNSLKIFPLNLVKSDIISNLGAVLIGDAAHKIHPLAGQGLNLGLGDAKILVEIISNRDKFRHAGDFYILKKYKSIRTINIYKMIFVTDLLYNLFHSSYKLISYTRNISMNLLNNIPYIKRFIIENASKIS